MSPRSRAVIPALVLISALAPAAHADHIENVGFTCSFASSNDPTGIIERDRNAQTGEVNGGPWTAADIFDNAGMPGTLEAAAIKITCTIQVDKEAFGGAAAANATCTGTGTGTVFVGCTIRYTALPNNNVYLCTEVTMRTAGGTETYVFDADDDPANGNQCALAISAERANTSPPATGGNVGR